ncbi:phage portal protein [Bradyrhizobium sp. BR 10261]|uniref:phage portal protein n=1 Tax=Bradyrhizobium sp. BR 10261 TaxID=2749992 RepID=UPI001C6503CC|nr:phage portal protein [Bradyrhizobium sp. BR 10261]MBW7964959.1 phage portal protein [Bradyrhizobium sp. BR 10261]
MTDDLNKLTMPRGLEKIATPRGEARSISSLANQPATSDPGADWFGPQQPLRPVAQEVAGRAYDYPTGFNLSTQPRAFEPLTFQMLRSLADSYDPVRLIIEKRKDQLTRLPWTIRAKHTGVGKRPKADHVSSRTRAIVDEVEQFFRYPSPELTFRIWIAQLLDDLLVLGAPTIYLERDSLGNLTSLNPVDAATVRRVIDERGRPPRPRRWDGRPFDWLGKQVTPQNYMELGFKIADGLLYPPAFQQILKGLPAANLTTLDLIYAPMRLRTNSVYGQSPLELIVTTVSTAFRRSMAQFEYFREGNQPDAVFSLPESWTPDQTMRFQEYWDSLFSGNLAARRRMKFIPTGTSNGYQALKEPPLKNEFDEWLVRIVCFAFSYPPAAFVSLSNRSIAEQHERTAEEEGVEPLKHWAAETINGIIEREFSDEVEFAWIEESDADPKVEAETVERLVNAGIISANEGRQRLGLEPSEDPAASQLMVKTATGLVKIGANVAPQDENT